LAGVAGVQLMDNLLVKGWLETVPPDPDAIRVNYVPSADGMAALAELGVAIPNPKSGKSIAFSCIDWTERRQHLGGPLGRSIVAALAAYGYIEQSPDSRIVSVTGDLDGWLSA
jgi:hypothetical protein